ncbi:NAD(P)/FAD-dependent oxidoreductase [Ramlibacter sp. MMS24-I3-19]|uniref:NAD(P)/FAD-dependent oxidoreductase n=1 Tax=Ramlibacter sp. MMS24-I3-19 TaxID=3416606 RepID=UPI003CFBF0C5
MDRVEAVVVGAGVVGLAVARQLALMGREVLVLEAADGIGTGTSSRNSEVIHAGIYYPAGSLKARLCVQGKQLLYMYCQERGIPHRRCGKLLVATDLGRAAALPGIVARAAVNGVPDLQLLTREQAQALEPAIECVAAALSPSTGIVDSHAFMLALQGDLENAGGLVALHTRVEQARTSAEGIVLRTADGSELLTSVLVNAAGLEAPALASRIEGLAARHVPRAFYAKGNYFTLSGRAPCSRLVYPVPDPHAHLAGLGVHLTIDLGGQAKFGPDVQWVPSLDAPGVWQVDPARAPLFEAEIRAYWPGLPAGALQPGYVGVRPKISGPGEPAADFVVQDAAVHGIGGLVNLFGIESPGLTSAMAIAELVATRLEAA